MTEPTYTYQKGKGWVIETAPVVTIRGKDYFAYPRLPEPKEYYIYDNKRSDWSDRDGNFNFNGVLARLNDGSLDLNVWKNNDPSGRSPAKCWYITLVKVNP